MRLRTVDPHKIHFPEVRVTSAFDSETLAMFKQSVKDLGILEPPLCIEVDGEVVGVDGLHRVVEAINKGDRSLQVVMMEGDMSEVLLQNLALNNLRGKIKPTEMTAVLKELYEEYHLGTDEIARRTGFSRDYVERLIWIGRARPEVLEALDDGAISVGHAFALARIPDEATQLRVLGQQLVYRFTVRQLEDHIKSIDEVARARVEAPPPEAPAPPPVFKCHFCQGTFPHEQIANPNICVMCAGVLAQSIAMARLEAEREAAHTEE